LQTHLRQVTRFYANIASTQKIKKVVYLSYLVRIPSLEDFDQINALGVWFQQNSSFSKCGWSVKKSLHLVYSGSQPESNTYMRVCEKDGEIVGLFIGNIVEYWFSEQKIANELVVLFTPLHRNKIAPYLTEMINGFTAWAEAKGATESCIGITSGKAGEGYPKFIESLGFSNAGLIFKKEV